MSTLEEQRLVGRVPPQALDVEQYVLSSMMCDRTGLSLALGLIRAEHFYKPAHQTIFAAMVSIYDRNENVDALTLTEELKRLGQLHIVGDSLYIADLAMRTTSSANIESHCKIVLQKYILRQIITIGTTMTAKAFNETDDALDLLSEIESEIIRVASITHKETPDRLIDLTYTAIDTIDKIRSGEKKTSGISTGFTKIDEYTGGFEPKNLIIVAARPSVGKTALALSMMLNMDVPSILFSAEMSDEAIALRALSQESRISYFQLHGGHVHSDHHRTQLTNGVGKIYNKSIFVDDTGSPSIYDIKTKTQQFISQHGVKAVFIDYLQLISVPRTSNIQNRDQEIGFITKSLKGMAKDFNIPVICLSQLSRGVESRADKRPVLSDLRESGNIEQDADIVIFPHRDKMDESVQPEIIIAKNRNGMVGAFDVTWIGDIMRFENYSERKFEGTW